MFNATFAQMKISDPSLEEIKDKLFEEKKIKVYVLRLDKIHPEINGNKYFKLKYNLEEAKKNNFSSILTFGGAFSNHILATAAAGKMYGIKTIGIIRGEELNENSNEVIKKAAEYGMQFHFVSREDYRKKETAAFIDHLKNLFGNFYLVPEGGSNLLAVRGASEISSFIKTDFDFICCACGTGGTIAGISEKLLPHQKAIGISVINAQNYFEQKIPELLQNDTMPENIFMNYDFHFGGYAKTHSELKIFKENFQQKHKMPVDEIYNAKLFYGLYKLAAKDFFPEGKTVICLNTGGCGIFS